FDKAQGSMAKLKAGEVANWVTDQAISICGGWGYARELPVQRWHRDAKTYTLFEGTREMQRRVIARAIRKGASDLVGRARRRRAGLSQFASALERARPIDGEAAKRFVALIGHRAVGNDVPGDSQRGVVGEVCALDAVERGFVVLSGVCRPAQEHQFERFQLHG